MDMQISTESILGAQLQPKLTYCKVVQNKGWAPNMKNMVPVMLNFLQVVRRERALLQAPCHDMRTVPEVTANTVRHATHLCSLLHHTAATAMQLALP